MVAYLKKLKEKLFIKESEDLRKAELFSEKQKRILLVIKVRWAIVAFYFIYGFMAILLISSRFPEKLQVQGFVAYGGGLIGLAIYNGFLHYFYERLSHFKGLAQAQMIIDIITTTVVIHYTGGEASWFWAIFILIILQSAFLFDRKIETIEIAILSGIAFGFLVIFERGGLIVKYSLPFLSQQVSTPLLYINLKIFWVLASSLVAAIIASYLLGMIRENETFLANKSITDGLTGLYNHSYFYKRLSGEIERAKRYDRKLSLLLIDIDDFKIYNDTKGHQGGDKLLSDIAEIFKYNIRANDVDTLYRYGGDEFAIIAPETSSEKIGADESGAAKLAGRIREKVEENLPVTVSIGVSSFPRHGDDVSKIFNISDIALYKAKENGKNSVEIAPQKDDEKGNKINSNKALDEKPDAKTGT